MAINVEELIKPVTPENPSGEDLEYAPDFLELDRMSHGKPEEQVGETVRPAEEADWRGVRDGALEIAKRTRDTRVALLLAVGGLQTEGLPGFSAGIAVLQGILEKFWDTCYPKLDVDDNNDPTVRLMTLSALNLANSGDGDPIKLKRRLQECPLSNSKQVGRFGLRDILVASGKLQLPPQPKGATPLPPPPNQALIDASFDDTSVEDLQAGADAIQKSIKSIESMDKLILAKAGPGKGPNLRDLVVLLQEMLKQVQPYLAKKGVAVAVPGQPGAAGAAPGAATGAPGGGAPGAVKGPAPISGDITSREDAMKMMDKICQYFEKHEPSSPVPILIKRAKKLTPMNFIDLIKDLSPDAIKRIEMIAGTGKPE